MPRSFKREEAPTPSPPLPPPPMVLLLLAQHTQDEKDGKKTLTCTVQRVSLVYSAGAFKCHVFHFKRTLEASKLRHRKKSSRSSGHLSLSHPEILLEKKTNLPVLTTTISLKFLTPLKSLLQGSYTFIHNCCQSVSLREGTAETPCASPHAI